MEKQSFYFISYLLAVGKSDRYDKITDALENMPGEQIFDRRWIVLSAAPTAGELRNDLARKWSNFFDYERDYMFVTPVTEKDCCGFPQGEVPEAFAELRRRSP